MEKLLFLLLLTTVTGVGGLALGGALAVLPKSGTPSSKILAPLTAGIMLAVVFFHMLPEALEHGSWLPVAVFMLLGGILPWLLHIKLGHHRHHKSADLRPAAWVLAGAVALHNLPVGMALGSSIATAGITVSSVLTAFTIGLHNLPEGMSIASPLRSGGGKPGRAVALAALAGIPTVLGGLIGFFVGSAAPAVLSGLLSFAAGAMLFVLLFELIPESMEGNRTKASLLMAAGLGAGFILLHLGGGHVH